jgi:hypothetical protein
MSSPIPAHPIAAWGAVLLLACLPALAEQVHYPTPEAAAQALVEAAAEEGSDALRAVLGPNLEDLRSVDPIQDADERADFVEAALLSAGIEQEEGEEDRAVLVIGPDDWPFPVPLARGPEGWYFDTAAGREELLERRIGRNELTAIAVARAFVEAQFEYAELDRNGDGIREFSQRLMSSAGARDGLYWTPGEGEPESPMGSLVAAAWAEGYRPGGGDGPKPYHGYLYRLLTAQGEHAPRGARSYLESGRLTKGFGLLAWPAEYDNSGVMSFQINQSGILFQKDLGADTAAAAAAIGAYDPGPGWEPVTD